MCGISGVFSFSETGDQAISFLEKATEVLASRGPDAKGYFKEQHIGLGHRRLSIIDVSTSANQPMSDPSGRYVIVFNGEILNFGQLK